MCSDLPVEPAKGKAAAAPPNWVPRHKAEGRSSPGLEWLEEVAMLIMLFTSVNSLVLHFFLDTQFWLVPGISGWLSNKRGKWKKKTCRIRRDKFLLIYPWISQTVMTIENWPLGFLASCQDVTLNHLVVGKLQGPAVTQGTSSPEPTTGCALTRGHSLMGSGHDGKNWMYQQSQIRQEMSQVQRPSRKQNCYKIRWGQGEGWILALLQHHCGRDWWPLAGKHPRVGWAGTVTNRPSVRALIVIFACMTITLLVQMWVNVTQWTP